MIAKALNTRRRKIRARLRRHPFLRRRWVVLLGRVIGEMLTRDATHMAGGLAYFAIFSLLPFVLGALVILGYLENGDRARAEFLQFISGNIPGSAPFVTENVINLAGQQSALLILSIIAVFWSSASVFSAINRVVNRAWTIYRIQSFYISRLRHLLALLIFTALFISSVTLSTLIRLLGEQDLGFPGHSFFLAPLTIELLLELTRWLISGVAFLLIYRYLPNCRVYWRHVWPGALAATTLFELSKIVFVIYVPGYNNTQQLYGSIASAIIFLFWVYLSAMILTLGAEICAQYRRIYFPGDLEDDDQTRVWSRTGELPPSGSRGRGRRAERPWL